MQRHERFPFLVWCFLIGAAVAVFSLTQKPLSQKQREEIAQIVENKAADDLMTDLYLASEGDSEALARILNVTPSTIDRVRNKACAPSYVLEDRIREVALYYYRSGKDFYKLRSELDPSWTLFHTIGFSRQTNPLLFWTVVIIISIFYLYFNFKSDFQKWKLTSVLLALVILFYAGCAFYANHFPRPMDDSYQLSINPAYEQPIVL